ICGCWERYIESDPAMVFTDGEDRRRSSWPLAHSEDLHFVRGRRVLRLCSAQLSGEPERAQAVVMDLALPLHRVLRKKLFEHGFVARGEPHLAGNGAATVQLRRDSLQFREPLAKS